MLNHNIKLRNCPHKTGNSEVVFVYRKTEYANTTSVSNTQIIMG